MSLARSTRLPAQLSELSAGMCVCFSASRGFAADYRFGYRLRARPAVRKPSSVRGIMSLASARPSAARIDSVMAERRDSRNVSTNASDVYDAVVVGAGPAGITAVGNLLETRIERILWVDTEFQGGRINKYYREVPSNTKVKLFIEFATAVAPFRKIVSGLPSRDRWQEPSPSDGATVSSSSQKLQDWEQLDQATNSPSDKLKDLRMLDQEQGCTLSHAGDICFMLTAGLSRTPGVTMQPGRVTEAVLDEQSSTWDVNISPSKNSPLPQNITNVHAKRIILCTGSSPIDPPLPFEPPGLEHIHLDTALSPTELSRLLNPLGPTTIAVIGASHSAVLVLWNLTTLALGSKRDLKIQWFTRHPLRYAEYERDFIARDNTGLKGDAAQWARENLEPEKFASSPISEILTAIRYEKGDEEATYREHLPGTAFVVQAIGYQRDPTPTLKLANGKEIEPVFDHSAGIFNYIKDTSGALAPLPGIYGAGIAFPEKVVDKKYGHEEMNVGFFKFMKAVKKWAEGWKAVGA